MNAKRILIIIASLAVLILGVSLAGAQDNPGGAPDRPRMHLARIVVDVAAEETGLEASEIVAQLRQGQTLADIITANNGDVQSVIDQAVTKAAEEISQAVTDGQLTQARADQLLSNLQDVITQGVNGELFPNRIDRGEVRQHSEVILLRAAAEATGLTPANILEQLAQGKTLAEVITTNGGNVDTVVNNAITAATEQINTAVTNGRLTQAQADELISRLPQAYADAVNGQFREEAIRLRVGRAIIRLAAEQTGLDAQEIRQELRSGKTLADILTEHNVDTNAFIESAVSQAQERLNKAVENGRLTQEEADQKLSEFRQHLTEHLNQSGVIDSLDTTA